MVYTVNKETRSRGLRLIGISVLMSSLVVWFPLRRLLSTVINDKYFFIVSASLGVIGVLILIVSLAAHILRARSMSVHEAKRYLVAFAHQYDTSINTDIANAVNAILVLERAGLFKRSEQESKRYGTVNADIEKADTDTVERVQVEKCAVQTEKRTTKAARQSKNKDSKGTVKNNGINVDCAEVTVKSGTVEPDTVEIYTLDMTEKEVTNKKNGNKLRTPNKKS